MWYCSGGFRGCWSSQPTLSVSSSPTLRVRIGDLFVMEACSKRRYSPFAYKRSSYGYFTNRSMVKNETLCLLLLVGLPGLSSFDELSYCHPVGFGCFLLVLSF